MGRAMTDVLQYLQEVENTNPQFAEYLRERFEKDRADFVKYVEEKGAPKDPRYWAKDSCNSCLGKGFIRFSGEDTAVSCRCVEKNYSRYLREMRLEYNLRDKNGNEESTSKTTGE